MTGRRPWRSLQSVMLVTLHVAVVAYILRAFTRPGGSTGSILLWVPITIGLALFLSWPISRAIASAFDPVEMSIERRCPRCGRCELRPLIRPRGGLFQPVTNYRCAACWTTFHQMGEVKIEEHPRLPNEPIDSSGVQFLDESATEVEIKFLDETLGSSV